MKYSAAIVAVVASTILAAPAPAPAKKYPFIEPQELCRNLFESCIGTEAFCAEEPDPAACLAEREPAPSPSVKVPVEKFPFIEPQELCRNPFESCVGTEAFCAEEPDPAACLAEREPAPSPSVKAPVEKFPFIEPQELCRNPFESCIGTEAHCAEQPDPAACLAQREPKPDAGTGKPSSDNDNIVFPGPHN